MILNSSRCVAGLFGGQSMADKIAQLQQPARETPKTLARKYMNGELDPSFYAKKPGGIYQLMRMADQEKSLVAAEKALKQLRDMSGIDKEQGEAVVFDIKLIDIENRDGKIVEMESA